MSSKKEELLKIACNALQKGGVSSFSFRDLATEAGIKSSSVHYHFKNKNELFREIIICFRESVTVQLTELVKPVSGLEDFLIRLTSFFEGVLDEEKFCVCGMLAAEMQHLDEDVMSELKDTFSLLENWLAENISAYEVDSEKAKIVSRVFISAVEGSLLLDRLMGKREHFDSLRTLIKNYC